MAVLRIVANLAAADPARARAFYVGVFGLDVLMDHGWIVTLGSDSEMTTQVSLASEGGSGTPFRRYRSRWMILKRSSAGPYSREQKSFTAR
jgi:catechol 2,3-dioxygenase-like lactoylglutathione lyase family enzyme